MKKNRRIVTRSVKPSNNHPKCNICGEQFVPGQKVHAGGTHFFALEAFAEAS